MKNKRGIVLLALAVLCGFGTIRAAHSYLRDQQPDNTTVALATMLARLPRPPLVAAP